MVLPLWKTIWWFLKKLNTELPHDPGIPLLGVYPKELKAGSQGDIHTPMFVAALFTTAKRVKQPKCPPMNDCISTTWHVHTTEYYSALKRKDMPIHATTQMNSEDIMLSEISETKKKIFCMSPLM